MLFHVLRTTSYERAVQSDLTLCKKISPLLSPHLTVVPFMTTQAEVVTMLVQVRITRRAARNSLA